MFSRHAFFSAVFIVLMIMTGCFLVTSDPDRTDDRLKLFIAGSDYHSGTLEWMVIEDNSSVESCIEIYSDAVLDSYNGNLYMLEKYGADNIMKFDPSKCGKSGIIYQIHLGNNWNPQDIEFLNRKKAYISNMNEPEITIFNPETGEIVSSIDISKYTYLPEKNSSPYAGMMQLVGKDLYVILQRRDGFDPGINTLILKIDTEKDSIVDTISLAFKEGSSIAFNDNALYVASTGDYGIIGDGGIERIDLDDGSVSIIIEEDEIGGSPIQIVHKEGSRFYVTSYVDMFDTRVLEIDASTGIVIKRLSGVKNAFGGIFYDKVDERLYVAERDTEEMGVRIFKDNQQDGPTVKTSLPPNSLMIMR